NGLSTVAPTSSDTRGPPAPAAMRSDPRKNVTPVRVRRRELCVRLTPASALENGPCASAHEDGRGPIRVIRSTEGSSVNARVKRPPSPNQDAAVNGRPSPDDTQYAPFVPDQSVVALTVFCATGWFTDDNQADT